MARRRRPEKREILPDPRFGDIILSKFMNLVMYEGKKSVAESIVYNALETVEAKTRRDPVGVLRADNGYIDENFTLYCSDCHSIAISLSAMNFILHCVQPDRPDIRFRFDEPASIEAVEEEMSARFLNGESVFNIEVFDHYLRTHPELLENAIEKLAIRVATDPSFFDVYCLDGMEAKALVGRLAGRWTGIFVHLVEHAAIDSQLTISLVDVAAMGVDQSVLYMSSDRVTQFFSKNYGQMQAFVGTVDASRSAGLALLLRRFGAQITDLAVLGTDQRMAVIHEGLYPVNRANLLAALGGTPVLSLDSLKAADRTVYNHAIANLDEYLDALNDDENTVAKTDDFVSVLSDIADADSAIVVKVAKRAAASCEVSDLLEIDEAIWPAIVESHRFAPTASNVNHFILKLGITDGLLADLSARDFTLVDELNHEARIELAYVLINHERPEVAARVRLLSKLKLTSDLDPERLGPAGLSGLPALLGEGLVPDAAETYSHIAGRPFTIREEYFAASKKLPSYVTNIALSRDDLPHVLRSRHVEPAAKRALVEDVDFVTARLNRPGAIAICEWANNGNELSIELLNALANADAPAEHVLSLLVPHLSDIELPVLDKILIALGDEYEPLTRPGRHSPRLKRRAGTEEVLEYLKARSRVSSFSDSKFGGIRVNMHH